MSGFRLTDPRLLAIADWIPPGAVAADVGTDHGHLICHLALKGVIARGYACDVAEQPLENARGQIKALGLEDVIEARLTDGLKGLPLESVTHVVIAGMGGELIARILADTPAKQPGLRLLLQPMTKAERLRESLCQMGYAILRERGVAAGRFLYTVMEASYTGERFQPDELFAWCGRLPQSEDPASRALLDRIARRLQRTGAGLSRSREGQALGERYLKLAERINSYEQRL